LGFQQLLTLLFDTSIVFIGLYQEPHIQYQTWFVIS